MRIEWCFWLMSFFVVFGMFGWCRFFNVKTTKTKTQPPGIEPSIFEKTKTKLFCILNKRAKKRHQPKTPTTHEQLHQHKIKKSKKSTSHIYTYILTPRQNTKSQFHAQPLSASNSSQHSAQNAFGQERGTSIQTNKSVVQHMTHRQHGRGVYICTWGD